MDDRFTSRSQARGKDRGDVQDTERSGLAALADDPEDVVEEFPGGIQAEDVEEVVDDFVRDGE